MVAAARLRRAEQRIAAMRPYAQAIRKMTQQVAEAAAETISVTLLEEREQTRRVGIAAGHRRPRPRGLVQHPDHPRGDPAAARVRGRRRRGHLRGRRPARQLDDELSRRERRQLLRRLHRPPRLRQRARDLAGPDHRLCRRGARPRRADLQPLRLAADPVRAPPDAAAAAGGRGLRRGHPRARGAGRRGAGRGALSAPTGSTSPTRSCCCRSCSRSTSTSRSTGRCSSRPRPSTARG